MHVCFILDDIILEHQPLGVCYISALLKEHGHKVSSVNADASPDYVQHVKALSPDILAFSTSSSQAALYQRINREIRKEIPGVFSLFGG
ncbi:MAG: cobalamin B12-binding domain-containing protein, partial [bacterium]